MKFSSKHFELIRDKIVNENILRTYEMHFLNLKIKNQFDIVRYFIDFFLKIDLSNEQFILNFFFYDNQFQRRLCNTKNQITYENRNIHVNDKQNI